MSNRKTTTPAGIRRVVEMALLTALVVVLQVFANYVPGPGGVALSFVMIPVVIGACLYGVYGGAWLGFVFAVTVWLCPSTAVFFGVSIIGTLLIVFCKGVLAGVCAGIVFKLLAKKNLTVSSVIASAIAPVINTGIFAVGACFFFKQVFFPEGTEKSGFAVFAVIITAVLWNFIFEFATTVVIAPIVCKVLAKTRKVG